MKIKTKYFKYSLYLFLSVLIVAISSCEQDDSPMMLNNSGQALTGKLKSLDIMSGINRVLIKGVVDDPNITEVRIYWDDRSDSVVLPVNSTAKTDTINQIIDGLQEKLYIFEAQTFDKTGQGSEIVSGGAKVFSASYADNIENRSIESSKLDNNNLAITFHEANPNSGIVNTEFTYENTADENIKLFIDKDKNILSISDFKIGSTYSYRTVFVPAPVAVDTFYTDYANFSPVQLPKLVNAKAPYEVAESEGRWGTLAEWTTTDPIKNHNGYGGWDQKNGFNVESGWGAPAITNGKIYQTVTAGAGDFTLNVEFSDNNHSAEDEGGFYIIVTKGDGLPNVENITTAPEVLGYQRVTEDNLSYSIDFTVDETGEISVGIVTTQGDSGRFGPIQSFDLLGG